ncbi:MAG: SMI1/KNR4 family protein [Capsulimonadaceae bacterium]
MIKRNPWRRGSAILDDIALHAAVDYTPRVKGSEMWAHVNQIAIYFALVGAVQDAMVVWNLAYSDPIPIPEYGEDAAVSALCYYHKLGDISMGRPRAPYLEKPEDIQYRVARYDARYRRNLMFDRWSSLIPSGQLDDIRTAIDLARPAKGEAYNPRDVESLPYFDTFIARAIGNIVIANDLKLLCCDIAGRHQLRDRAVTYLRSWYDFADPRSTMMLASMSLWEPAKLCFQGTLAEMSALTVDDRRTLVVGLLNTVRASMQPGAPKPAYVDNWPSFLQEFNARFLESDHEIWTEPKPAYLGHPGASEEQIAAAEARLGVTLPPSYRAFLMQSNGWAEMGASYPGELRSVDTIDRPRADDFRACGLDEMDLDQLRESGDFNGRIAGGKSAQDILMNSIQISEWGDACVLLLSPDIVGQDGEWYCLDYASWHPGFNIHTGFAEWFRQRFDGLIPDKTPRNRPRPRRPRL